MATIATLVLTLALVLITAHYAWQTQRDAEDGAGDAR